MWACVMCNVCMYPSRQCIGGKAGNVHVLYVIGEKCVFVFVWSTRVRCVGGLILESHTRRALVWERRRRVEGYMEAGLMDAGCRFIFSSHYLIHIFSAHERGEGCFCVSSPYMHGWNHPAHSRNKPRIESPVRQLGLYSYFQDGFSVLVRFHICLGFSEG